jgi:hypothetical protein
VREGTVTHVKENSPYSHTCGMKQVRTVTRVTRNVHSHSVTGVFQAARVNFLGSLAGPYS